MHLNSCDAPHFIWRISIHLMYYNSFDAFLFICTTSIRFTLLHTFNTSFLMTHPYSFGAFKFIWRILNHLTHLYLLYTSLLVLCSFPDPTETTKNEKGDYVICSKAKRKLLLKNYFAIYVTLYLPTPLITNWNFIEAATTPLSTQ